MNPFRQLGARLVPLAVVTIGGAGVAPGLAHAKARTTPGGAGVVVIKTELADGGGAAEGTGMVLTSSGEILTNNHVIRDASTIEVVIPRTRRSYSAKVLGYDATADVAVLQATRASHLETVSTGDSSAIAVGQPVIATGNAGGKGSLVSTSGRVTGVARAISVGDGEGGSESLTGLIATNANLEPGDSGGPLLDAAHEVIGMNTAASVTYRSGSRDLPTGPNYAIPINRALAIAAQIEAGKPSASVHVGPTAFLGVEVALTTVQSGALIEAVAPGSAAAAAGLTAGDWIMSIDGHTVTSSTTLQSTLVTQKVGVPVPLRYIDASGKSRTTRVTFRSGAPQ